MLANGAPSRLPGGQSRRQWARERWHNDRKWEAWGGRPPGPRIPARLRLWLPVIISLVIQLPSALWMLRVGDRPDWQAAVTLALAVIGPFSLLLARRLPGPVVAFVALAAAADILLAEPNFGPPYIALAFAIGVRSSAGPASGRGCRSPSHGSRRSCWPR